MTLAILCSGQGLQHPDMFALTADAPQATPLFERAASLMAQLDPRTAVRNADPAWLHRNRNGQILCVLQPLAAALALMPVLPSEFSVAGYSIGELAAWALAGAASPETILMLAMQRAEAMDAASQDGDGLVFVRGLSESTIAQLCREYDADVAIVNPGDAWVIGAAGANLDALADRARQAGASRVTRLAVSVASHTPRMAAAARSFRQTLEGAGIARLPWPGRRLFSGLDGQPVLDAHSGLDKLARQIAEPVQWAACLEGCVEAGTSVFLEFGPGRALAEMAANTYPTIPARSLDDFRSLDGVRTWLSRVLG